MVTLQTAPQGDCGCKKKEPVMKKTDLRYPKDVWCFLLSWGGVAGFCFTNSSSRSHSFLHTHSWN